MPRASPAPTAAPDARLRRTVVRVALLNLAYFGVEFAVALTIGAVSLIADSVDFLEDAAVNLLIAVALGWTVARRARVGAAMAGIMLIPAAAFLWALWAKWQAPIAPAPAPLTLAGLGALAVNLTCAWMLAKVRDARGSLTRAAFLSARNDAAANLAIIAAGALTFWTGSLWPDVVAGLGIAALNADAAYEVWEAARGERAQARLAA